ncbi:sensor histidine kinase [Lichenicoccus sp.]|uniref:sensor histidine kinase n=1 Tax=Lichenicoccus sp. TaxID=2781899 RepID=UPI003D14E271
MLGRPIFNSLGNRLVGSMSVLLFGGLALVSGLHSLERGRDLAARVGRLLLGDELPEPWQDLAILLPFSLVVLGLIGGVTRWSLRPLRLASEEAKAAGPGNPGARISTRGLPSELRPLADAVNAALDRLTAAYETERRFTADAAHELRTPLAALGLRLQRSRRSNVPIDWLDVETDLAAMRQLVESLLDLARKEVRGRTAAVLNFSRIVREAAAGVHPLIEEAGRELLVELPGTVLVRGEANDLRDLARNLVQNALRHGSGRIALRLSHGADGRVVLDVADEGQGIPVADRDAMFERFRKGSNAGSGSGLGLAIARAVAVAHSGQITIPPGPGSLVRVTLPGA